MDGVGAMGDPGTSTGAAMAFKGPDLMSQAAAGQDDLMSGKAPPAAVRFFLSYSFVAPTHYIAR